MAVYNSIIRPLLFRMDAELAHEKLINWLKYYKKASIVRPEVKSYFTVLAPYEFENLHFRNRIGLSAGFDKNAVAFDLLADFGFGFIEIGTVTPDSQPGNPTPRIFRLINDESLISRTGFNNDGLQPILERIKQNRRNEYVLGVNINQNPLSEGNQAIEDFKTCFKELYSYVDYFTLNWGSIDSDVFTQVVDALTSYRKEQTSRRSIIIKLPADITPETIDKVISIGDRFSIDGFIATGPTMDRSLLSNTSALELDSIGNGNVSGKGIGDKSLKVVKYLFEKTQGRFLIIGAGGIMNLWDAKAMIDAGADLIQIYSAFIFSGPTIVKEMAQVISSK